MPDGTTFIASARKSVHTSKARPGDTVEFETTQPTLIGGAVVVPRSARLLGTIVESQSAKTSSPSVARLSVLINSVTWKGRSVHACASVVGIALVNTKPRVDPALESTMKITDPARAARASGQEWLGLTNPGDFLAPMMTSPPVAYQWPKDLVIERFTTRPSVFVRPKKDFELPKAELLVIRQMQGGAGCSWTQD